MKKPLTPEQKAEREKLINERAEHRKAKTVAKKKEIKLTNRKYKKSSDRTAMRKTRMKPEERENLRSVLIAHFGASIIDKAVLKCATMKEQDSLFLEFRFRMEREIEAQEKDLDEYYKKLDIEHKAIGRPKSVFNFKEMEYLCSIGCTLKEIAGFFQVYDSTVTDRIKEEFGLSFNEYYERHSQGIKVALRRRQIKLAMDGDGAMLKFLGKNILGQKEKVEFDGQVKVNSWVDLMNNLDDDAENDDAEPSES